MPWMRGFLIVLLAAHATLTLAEPQPEAARPVAAAEEDRFDIFEFQVEGNSVLPALTIEETVYPFLGEMKSFKEVEGARAALEKAYHDAGYLSVLVDIPEQDVKAATVRLNVVEAQVERLKVTGSRYYSLGYIKSKTPDLAEGSVPKSRSRPPAGTAS